MNFIQYVGLDVHHDSIALSVAPLGQHRGAALGHRRRHDEHQLRLIKQMQAASASHLEVLLRRRAARQ